MSTTTIDLDEKTYRQLLGRTLPHVIHTDKESERLTNELLRLDERESPSPEEKELAELLTVPLTNTRSGAIRFGKQVPSGHSSI
jgi:hypothetical protein